MKAITDKLINRICKLSDDALVELLKGGDAIQVSESWSDLEGNGHDKVTIQLKRKK